MSPSRCQSLGRTQVLCRFLQLSATYWKRVDFPEVTKYTFFGGEGASFQTTRGSRGSGQVHVFLGSEERFGCRCTPVDRVTGIL